MTTNTADQIEPRDPITIEQEPGQEMPALGIHPGLSFEQYVRLPGINKSGLDNLAIAPEYYQWHKNTQQIDTQAFAMGHAFHALVLEPETFADKYVPAAFEDFRTKEAKAWRDQQIADGRTILRTKSDDPLRKPSEWDTVHRMRDALAKNQIAMTLIEDVQAELTCLWMNRETARLCKCRLDAYNPAHRLIVDIKTTVDATMSGFSRSVHDYRYDVQDAWYTDGARAAGLDIGGFVFVVIQKTPPFLNACYALPPDWRRIGRTKYRHDLEIYDECKRSNEWPGLPPLRDLELPGYAKFNRIS